MPEKIPRNELLQDLKKVALEVSGDISRKEYVEKGKYSAEPFYEEFGSWNEAKKVAGIEIQKPSELTREEMLEEIRRLAEEVRNPPRKADLAEYGKYSSPPYYDEFGSWNEAVDAAGFDPYENLEPYTTVECDYCGEGVRKKKSELKKKKYTFCSRSCKHRHNSEVLLGENHPQYDRVTLECPVCGGEFDVIRSMQDVRECCSRECQAQMQSEGGVDFYRAVRKQISDKSWWKCRKQNLSDECYMCGSDEEEAPFLILHHIIPVKAGGANEPWNLITLCPSCHRNIESYTKEKIVELHLDPNNGR